MTLKCPTFSISPGLQIDYIRAHPKHLWSVRFRPGKLTFPINNVVITTSSPHCKTKSESKLQRTLRRLELSNPSKKKAQTERRKIIIYSFNRKKKVKIYVCPQCSSYRSKNTYEGNPKDHKDDLCVVEANNKN